MTARTFSLDGFDYSSVWSERDRRYIITVRQYPSLSASSGDEQEALDSLASIAQGIHEARKKTASN